MLQTNFFDVYRYTNGGNSTKSLLPWGLISQKACERAIFCTSEELSNGLSIQKKEDEVNNSLSIRSYSFRRNQAVIFKIQLQKVELEGLCTKCSD